MKKHFSSYWIRSAFFSILQRFSITLFGTINFIVLIRSLSKEQMGTWALFLVVTSIFETTKSGLLKNAHIRYVSSDLSSEQKSAIASSSLLINASVSFIFIVLLLIFSDSLAVWLHAGADLSITLKWFIPGLIFMVLFSHLEAIQQSHLDFKGVFAGYFIRQLIFFIIISIHALMHIPFSLAWLAMYQSISVGIGSLVLYIYSKKYLLFRFDPTLAWVKKIVGYGGYIFGSGIMGNIFANVDQLMIATFMTSSSVAYYSAASKLNQLVDIPSYAASEIIFPKVSKASVEDGNDKVRYLYEKMVAMLLCVTVPTAIFVIIFPKLIITIIAGRQYAKAALILQLYMITGILRPMQNQSANLLNSIGKSRLCFIINTVSLAVNLLVNYICLSRIGFYGAAVGTLITCTLGMTAWCIIMNRQIGSRVSAFVVYSLEFYKLFYDYVRNFLSKRSISKGNPI